MTELERLRMERKFLNERIEALSKMENPEGVDLIDRNDLISTLKKAKLDCGPSFTSSALGAAIQWVENHPFFTVELFEWIPCSERLPEEPGKYICTCRWDENGPFRVDVLEYGKPVVDRWSGSNLVFSDGSAFGENWGHDGKIEMDNIEEVIAWMPLPDRYEEEK